MEDILSDIKLIRKNKSKILHELLGGKWTYDKVYKWVCDDGREVVRTASCSCDYDCGHPPAYWLYENNKVTAFRFV